MKNTKKLLKCPCCLSNLIPGNVKYTKRPDNPNWENQLFNKKTLVKCSSCGSIFLREVITDTDLNSFYNDVYKEKGKKNKSYPNTNFEIFPRSLSQANFINTMIDLKNGIEVLEIGPNEVGMIASLNLFKKIKYFYIDQNNYPIINYFGGKNLAQYFSTQTSISKRKFDLIALSHSLEHFNPSTLNNSINFIYKSLKKDGSVFIEVPNETISTKTLHKPHTIFFSVKGIFNLLERNKFTIVSMQITNNSKSQKPKKYFFQAINIFTKILIKIFKPPIIIRKFFFSKIIMFTLKNYSTNYDGRSFLRIIAQKSNSFDNGINHIT